MRECNFLHSFLKITSFGILHFAVSYHLKESNFLDWFSLSSRLLWISHLRMFEYVSFRVRAFGGRGREREGRGDGIAALDPPRVGILKCIRK